MSDRLNAWIVLGKGEMDNVNVLHEIKLNWLPPLVVGLCKSGMGREGTFPDGPPVKFASSDALVR